MQVLTCQPRSNSDSSIVSPQTNVNSRSNVVSSPARRCLFGRPQPGEESNECFVKRLLEELQENYKKKWDFDFAIGQPLANTTNTKYEYTPIPNEEVPGFYRMSSYAKHSYKVHPHYIQEGRYIEEEEDYENSYPTGQHNSSVGQSSSSSMLLNDSTSSSSASFLSESSMTEKDENDLLQSMDLVEECVAQGGSSEFEDEEELAKKSPKKLLQASSGRKKAAITPKKAQTKLTDFMPQRRKNLQRSAKKSDLKAKSDSSSSPSSPLSKAAVARSSAKLASTKAKRRRSTVGARLAAAAGLQKQA